MMTKYYQCPECGRVLEETEMKMRSGCPWNACSNPHCPRYAEGYWTKMNPVEIVPVTQKPLGLVMYAPTHSHAKGEECTNGCPVRQWHSHAEKWGNPYPAYPATQESDDEKIERMARAIYERDRKSLWKECNDKWYWRDDAKAALAALQISEPPAPELPEGVLWHRETGGLPWLFAIELTSGRMAELGRVQQGDYGGIVVTEQYILDKIAEDMEGS